jgi:hypothetical protein
VHHDLQIDSQTLQTGIPENHKFHSTLLLCPGHDHIPRHPADIQEAINGLFVERAQGFNGLLSGLTVGLRLWFSKISGKKRRHENGSKNAEHGNGCEQPT